MWRFVFEPKILCLADVEDEKSKKEASFGTLKISEGKDVLCRRKDQKTQNADVTTMTD